MRTLRSPSWVLVAVIAGAAPAAAQQGTLVGRVTTEAGMPVPAAQIQVLRAQPPVAVLADDQGRYRAQLPPGTYDLVVTSIGSRERRIDNVSIVAGQTTTLDIVLATRVEELDPLQVTASRGVEERQTETVAQVHSITSVEIEERPAQTLADHIRSAPGVDIITQGLQSTNVVVRGFNNIFSGALHMLTDYRLASVPSLRVNLMHFIPSTELDVERMEVVLGPGSALYGPNTANGVVHVLTKSPLDSEGTTVTLGAGERSVFQGSLRSAWALGERFGIKVSGQYLRGDEWPHVDPTEEAARLQAESPLTRQICLDDKAVRGLSPIQAEAACDRVGRRNYDIERWSTELRGDWRFADDGAVVATYGRSDASGIELTGLGAGQTDNWVSQFFQARVSKGRFFAQAYYNTSDAGDTYLLQSGLPLVDESSLFVGQLQHGFGLLEGRQDFTYGVDYFATRPDTRGTINGIYEPDDDIDEVGVYLQSRTALTDEFSLVLAGRMDHHSVLDDQVWSPRVGLVYNPVPGHSFRASYNRAFSTPGSLNFFLDVSGGLAPTIGPLGYSVRAFGTGANGWSLQPGGVTQVRSPFIGGGLVLTPPPDASQLWPAAVGVLFEQGAIDATTRDQLLAVPPSSADVGWALVDPVSRDVQPLAGTVLPDVPPIRESYTESYELGWTGLFANRIQVSADVYYMKRNDFISPLLAQTPLLSLSGPDLVAYLTPLVGAANAVPLATGLAQVPLGVVSSTEVNAQGSEIILTYRNVGDVDLWGADLAFEWFVTDNWALSGSYSHVSETFFEIEGGDPIALNAPAHKGSLGLAYRNLRAGVTGGVRVRAHGEFPAESAGYVGTVCVTGPTGGAFEEDCVDAATLVDLNFSWRVPRTDATLQLTVTNLFDEPYRSFVGVPEVGRLALLSVRYDLF